MASKRAGVARAKSDRPVPQLQRALIRRRFFWGHTWLGWLNLLVFQWFWVRFSEEVTVPEGRHLYWYFAKERPLQGWS